MKSQASASTRSHLLELLAEMTDQELEALLQEAQALLKARKKIASRQVQKSADATAPPSREQWVGSEAPASKARRVTIRVEYRKCGKNCKCNGGKGHGPYRYMYWWENGRTRSRYLGKA